MGMTTRRLLLGREAVLLIAALWLLQFLLITTRQNISDGEAPGWENGLRRAAISLAGAGLFYVIGLALVAVRRGGVALRVALALPLAIAGAALHVIINNLVFFYTMPPNPEFTLMLDPVSIFVSGTYWIWGYLSWAVIAIALAYSIELRDRDRQLAESEALAHRAQLRALRYQINPHFLFNALNATSALVTARETARAEEMLANLADFLRASLATDPLDDIPLGAELDYARLYLQIEQVRFSDRLRVEFDVPDRLRGAMVPSLILQPIFENAIKHAVSPATSLVTIRASAQADGDRLLIEVADDGTRASIGSAGTGVGLVNISQRLSARFGAAGSLTTCTAPAGGYVATLALPLRFAAAQRAEMVAA
jgi:two-component system, LytTR family, sensor kinase